MNNEILKLAVQNHPDKIVAPFGELYERMGFEGLCAICDLYGSSNIYIPSKKRMIAQCLYAEIKNEGPETHIRDIVRKYGVCERTVRSILYERWNE